MAEEEIEDPVVAAEEAAARESAATIINDKLAEYGLEELAGWALDQLTIYGIDGIDTILILLKDQPTYKERFAGNELRRENGLTVLTEAQYLNEELAMRTAAEAAGLPAGFYDSPEDFANFIGNGVTADEYQDRVGLAAAAVRSINPELRDQLASLYGIGVGSDGDLIAYYLDPERAVSILEQRLQLEAAGLSAASVRTLGQGVRATTAEQLAAANVQEREIGDRLSRSKGLVNNRMFGEERSTSADEVVAAEFGLDSDATRRIRALRRRRQEASKRQSGALATGAGGIGLGSAGDRLTG